MKATEERADSPAEALAVVPYIQVRQLSVRYADKPALSNIYFSAAKGTITALIGPSGCGKTTFLACLNRLTDMVESCRVAGHVAVGRFDVMQPDTDVLDLRRHV